MAPLDDLTSNLNVPVALRMVRTARYAYALAIIVSAKIFEVVAPKSS
jgi:hypothetical protein